MEHSSDQTPAARPPPPPRRELQGPRPAPLKVRKDSHKIKKPPVAPPAPQEPAARSTAPHRPPVIIYTVSPKVIHANPSEFMSLVQRLTGASFSSSASAAPGPSRPLPSHVDTREAGMSPAARLATIERGRARGETARRNEEDHLGQLGLSTDAVLAGQRLDRVQFGSAPGILSPIPSSLPAISPTFFSPWADVGGLSFLQELSPALVGSRNVVDNSFMAAAAPGNFISTPMVLSSPGAYWELFHHYQDL